MPYDSLMPRIAEEGAALSCARLYLRRGKRYLQASRNSAGIAALYDSILFGMRYYITKHKSCKSIIENLDLWDATGLFQALARAGIFDDPLGFNRFSLLVERALWQESFSFDADPILAEVERMLTKLGVIPFTESALPNEASSTVSKPPKMKQIVFRSSGEKKVEYQLNGKWPRK